MTSIHFIDPCKKERDPDRKPTLEEYSLWDLHAIKCADIVFVYLEKDNPGIVGAAVEAGYAKGLGKTVILVQERENAHIKDRYIDFVKSVSDIVFDNLSDGIAYLKTFNI